MSTSVYVWCPRLHTAHMCRGIKTLKHNMRTALRLTRAVKISHTPAKHVNRVCTSGQAFQIGLEFVKMFRADFGSAYKDVMGWERVPTPFCANSHC